VGLWDEPGDAAAAPPWCWDLDRLAFGLFDAWSKGGVWDEARAEPELLRAPPEHREPSPVRALKDLVLAALAELGEARWIPVDALLTYVFGDPRIAGLERLFSRWAARVQVEPPSLPDVVRRVITASLPALGLVDVGELELDARAAKADGSPLAVRVTARGKLLVRGRPSDDEREEREVGEFVEPDSLRVGNGALVGNVLRLARAADLVGVAKRLELHFDAATLARGLAAGLEVSELRQRIEAFGQPASGIERALHQTSAVLGRASFVGTAGFLWVDDPDVRELLRTRLANAEAFVEPSPPGGLLVAPGADLERLVRGCRALGVEVEWQGPRSHAVRRPSRPAVHVSLTQRRLSWRPPLGSDANDASDASAASDETERDGTD
jgi:hypothetical protein